MRVFALILLAVGRGQAAPDVIAHTTQGSQPAAPLLEMTADFSVKLGGKQPMTVPGGELISLRRAGLNQPGACPPPFLELTTGDRLPLALPLRIRTDDDALHAALGAPVSLDDLAVPQAAVARIALAPAAASGPRKDDEVVLKSGDRLAGKIAGIDAKTGVRLVVAEATQTIPFERLAQIRFNPEFQARPRMKNPYADVFLAGGARLSLAQLKSVGEGGQMAAVSLLGSRLSFTAADLRGLRMRQGKAVYLDELKPQSYTSTPFLDVAWPLAVGHTVLGRPLQIGDDAYPLGLGMHSRSRAVYARNEADAWFEATVAVDAAAGPRAAVKIDVERDGTPVPGIARLLKAGDAPVSLRIDMNGCKTLTLVTDFGPRGDLQGHAIWADARLIRK